MLRSFSGCVPHEKGIHCMTTCPEELFFGGEVIAQVGVWSAVWESRPDSAGYDLRAEKVIVVDTEG